MTMRSAPMNTNLRDAHLHLAEHGEELSCIQLADCTGVDQCLQRIAGAATDEPADTWIKATGARIEGWREQRYPTADELEQAGGGRPTFVLSFDHHAMAVSTTVLKLADISADTPNPEGGVIDKRHGVPTGLLLESACNFVGAVRPEWTIDQRREHILAALADLAALGYVEVHDMHSETWLFQILSELDRVGKLDMTVRMYATPRSFDDMLALVPEHESARVRLAGLKLFTDGTLNSRTAFMLEPFADPIPDAPRGTPFYTADQLDDLIRRADSAGYPVAAHAIGDGAVRAMLDAFQRVSPSAPGQRIEHCQFVDEADIHRFAELGVIASLQPCHLLTDIEAIRRLTPSRAGRAFPLRELIGSLRSADRDPAEGIWLGSDTPVVPPDPQDNIQAAVHRRRAGMSPVDAIAPEQAISEAECWSLMRVMHASD